MIRNLKTPKDLKEGRYIVKGIATYTNANNTMEATAISYVSIEIPLLEREYYGHPLWMYLILAVVLLITATTTGYVYKKKKEEEERRRRYKALLQLKNLPKASPKNAFIGKVAETGIRAFIRLNDLMTHALIAGATGAGKTIAAQVIAEEALLHNKNVVVFDPTGQWTGFLRACKNRAMLKKYPLFGMKEKDARGFEGSIKLVESPDMKINIKELLEPKKARITVFVLDRLSPEQIDKFVANTVKQVFNQRPEEQKELKLLMVYDEVHRLLPKFGGSGEGFLQIERAVREFRKWGIGLILISQVLSDFVGEIRANIGMEIQTRTRYEKDLERIARKYGEE
ncbi:MAG TPA: DUF853 family protein, partial [Candidatus Aenigmarchaeota archaeon]|nr:DUF853 family protein [Candidatus Aenigmarchaeota archaeon]HEX33042.1 DUF853 family protein [Candidatus Aenigmarchaeota archaeon]